MLSNKALDAFVEMTKKGTGSTPSDPVMFTDEQDPDIVCCLGNLILSK
jgi:hypothetical protein